MRLPLPPSAFLSDGVHPMVANHVADLAKGALRVVIDSRLAFGRVLPIP